MKIGVACYPTFGGSGVMATELGLALAERGHTIHFFAYEQPIRLSGFRKNITYHQVNVLEYPLFKYPSYNLALATKMADVAEKEKLDVLHVHYAIPHAVSAFLAREMLGRHAIKTAVTLHGTDITVVGTDPSYWRVTRFCLERADGVTAVSAYLKAETLRMFNLPAEIDVIPNFVDVRRFRCVPCEDARALRGSDATIFCHVSNFRPVKRIHDLILAFARIADTTPCRLMLVGDGPERPSVERLVQERGIADRVQFLGMQEDVESILPCVDVFVLPSEFESFGLAALEAMACGVPVIASAAGGLPEVIRHEETGLLYAMGDVEQLSNEMLRLARDPNERRRLGKAAREDATRRFSMAEVVSSYESFYSRLMGT